MNPEPEHDAAYMLEQATQVRITDALKKIVGDRAVIEQAKGMLMAIYGVDEVLAFKLLVWRSQETNTKLQPMAQQLVQDFVHASDHGLETRRPYDVLLMTVHDRLSPR